MDTLDNIIDHLSDEAALATLAVVLRRAGLAPNPFSPESPEDQLRQALRQPDLPPLEAPPGPGTARRSEPCRRRRCPYPDSSVCKWPT
jgi:hypothetical protein